MLLWLLLLPICAATTSSSADISIERAAQSHEVRTTLKKFESESVTTKFRAAPPTIAMMQREREFDEAPRTTTTERPTTTKDPMLVDLDGPRPSSTSSGGVKNQERKHQGDPNLIDIALNEPDVVRIAPNPDVGPQHPIPGSVPQNQAGSSIPEMGVGPRPEGRVESCYSGFSLLNGETVATGTQQCDEIGDYCYNATIHGPVVGSIGKAGCSTSRCKLAGAQNRCVDVEMMGYKVHFCCCNTGNLCNSKYTNLNVIEKGIEQIKDGFKFVDKILDMVG
ncbi:unnamed protein product, partial [Mesorhabditis spiculigera]